MAEAIEHQVAAQLSPRAREILAAARTLLDGEGIAGVSMRRIADRVGIRAASIYKHFPDKEALEAALISDGLAELAELFESALAGGGEAAIAFAEAYRAFAKRHPHLYRLMTERPLPRERLTPGVEERAGRSALVAAGEDPDLARALWAFAHGMTILELNERFPADADLEAAWRRGLAAFRRAEQS
jgi:AcrR family transcriptional regulator